MFVDARQGCLNFEGIFKFKNSSNNIFGFYTNTFTSQHKIWSTLERDPAFAHHATKPTLKETRLLTLQRAQKLAAYNFMPAKNLLGKPEMVGILNKLLKRLLINLPYLFVN